MKMKELNSLLALMICAALVGCGDEGNTNGGDGGGDGPANVDTAPLELTTDLCDDPANMTAVLESPSGNALFASGQFNEEQVERMIASPTEGPFYMFNLIRYREEAVYADGRETDLTGRELSLIHI